MKIKAIKIYNPKHLNFIIGQSHFIKTVEDLYEALITSFPGIKFGLAFSEASGICLIRTSGTSPKLENLAAKNLKAIAAGHSFIIFLENCFPINVLGAIKKVDEVCQIFGATANETEVIVYTSQKGNAILGIVDGLGPKGREGKKEIKKRKQFLREIAYKL